MMFEKKRQFEKYAAFKIGDFFYLIGVYFWDGFDVTGSLNYMLINDPYC